MDQTNRQIDLGTMTLYDSNAVPVGKTEEETQNNIIDAMVENVKFIFVKAIEAKKNEISLIQSLPQEQQIHDFTKSKLYLNLPESGIQFPRGFKLPEQKILTKWQRFAKEKNIKKKKKTGMVHDSQTGMMLARWGAKSKKNSFEPAIMEEKQFGKNPFAEEKQKRGLNKSKQQLKELKNLERKQLKRNDRAKQNGKSGKSKQIFKKSRK